MNNAEKNIDMLWDSRWSKYELKNVVDVDKIDDPWTAIHLDILKKELSALPPNGKFLEAGCGLGQWCFYVSKIGHRAVGVDIAKDIIKNLNEFISGKNEYQNIKFIVDDLTHSKLESNQFDFIVSLGVIEHFPDSAPMLNELYRLLKPNGKIFISVPNIFALHTITRPLTKLFGWWKIGYEKSYTSRRLIAEIKKSNFKLERIGILPSGQFFGRILTTIPLFGSIFKKIGYLVEKRQNVFGLYIYVICKK